jgi:predicted transcriptional regulator
MRVIDAVRRSGIGVTPERTVEQTAAVMERAGVGCIAVLDGDTLVGIVTDGTSSAGRSLTGWRWTPGSIRLCPPRS